MDPTIQLLWNRRIGGRPEREVRDWACGLLEQGKESEAILRLAGGGYIMDREERRLLEQALLDLGMGNLLDDRQLVDAYELASVADYYAGRLSGGELIDRGCDLYYQRIHNGKAIAREFWIRIAGDADQHGGQGICCAYPFNRLPFDEALKLALADNGFPERDFAD